MYDFLAWVKYRSADLICVKVFTLSTLINICIMYPMKLHDDASKNSFFLKLLPSGQYLAYRTLLRQTPQGNLVFSQLLHSLLLSLLLVLLLLSLLSLFVLLLLFL